MDYDYNEVSMRLRRAKVVDLKAMALCTIMTSSDNASYENEDAIKIERKGDLAFSLHVHRREIVARYSHRFIEDSVHPLGRFEFLLMPEVFSAATAEPTVLFHFDFNAQGAFTLGHEELACNPDDFNKSYVRNAIINFTAGALQDALTNK